MLRRSILSAAFRGRATRRPFSIVAPRGASVGKERPSDSQSKKGPDPFSLVADELSLLANRLRSMVATEVPKLASAAEYFFKMGVEGKRFRPTVLLLMSSALNVPIRESIADGVSGGLSNELRSRQQSIAEITEMIHVASLLHDDVLDDADTRRGIGSLNFVMGNKLAVLAGNFLLARACILLASLKNTEVVSLMATAIEHLVTGEKMQMTTTSEQRRSMEYYLQKTYNKTASLVSNSCKAIAVLAGQTSEVSMLAYEYGRNLGVVTAPILFAIEEFPQLREVVDRGFKNPADVDIALGYLGKSCGIERTRELAKEHANRAVLAIEALPASDAEDVLSTRRALIDLTHREGPDDPFLLVADELSLLANRLRSLVVTEVPKLTSAAEYFFKMGVEGKRMCPTVLLLMASALNVPVRESIADGVSSGLSNELRSRQQAIAEITEMIHVASLLHDDVLDDADTRRGIGSLNFVMGNKLAVLAGDFLFSRACISLASLKNTEVVSLMATAIENLVTGEKMQMTTTSEQRRSMEYYLQKTYYKTASLVSNSCKAIAVLAGQTSEVSMLAYEYGRNLGVVTAPILFAIEEFPQLREVVDRGFKNPADVDIALGYLGESCGIERTRELAKEHANRAVLAIEALPESDAEDVQSSRRALINLTHRVLTRTK
ncbi:Solanesyl-diphosphate synthase 1, mitochondrial [Ananas comosus]|uniref:Solanesyl-diphosphate synthase 1, mitochondrial n=1 Tax=Ananas comosus TaxID=4615 RepID=A0A199VD01_ANACO|nr:Solanesyl-diphosphate synthase 1, mitochondrial [Ananas comosus]